MYFLISHNHHHRDQHISYAYTMAPTAKALPEALTVSPEAAATLRIAIVHARWNTTIIEPLVKGTKDKLLGLGVKESNIVVQSVPGSWELPIAVQRYCSSP